MVRTFLAIPGTEADVANKAGETALMYAALHGNAEAAQLLIEKGAEVNRTGWTPLHYGAAGGSEAVVRLLLENHAYIDAESPNRTTPLMLAIRQRHGDWLGCWAPRAPTRVAQRRRPSPPTMRNAPGPRWPTDSRQSH